MREADKGRALFATERASERGKRFSFFPLLFFDALRMFFFLLFENADVLLFPTPRVAPSLRACPAGSRRGTPGRQGPRLGHSTKESERARERARRFSLSLFLRLLLSTSSIDLATAFFPFFFDSPLILLLLFFSSVPKTVQDRAVQAPGDDGPELRW